ncbi:MAG TPA: glycosyltransferase family 2 protein [Candidatus Methylomirabilis sp.]|nr:glycosyltransferase family 2 protein [Candidatus Methylomirabilis sp.]
MDYLKVGKADELAGGDRIFYRLLEIFPGAFSWGTLLILIIFSYFKPVWVAYFIIAFDVYWLLLVLYLGIMLFVSYFKMKKIRKVDWQEKCRQLDQKKISGLPADCLARHGVLSTDLVQLIIVPTAVEAPEVLRSELQSIVNDGFPTKQMIYVLAIEEREGEKGINKAKQMREEFSSYFRNFLVTTHPNIIGELKGKGANQAWAAKRVKEEVVDKENIPYDKIIVSVFDSDTIVYPGFFSCLAYSFLTVSDPYRASYQPIPLYHNNVWEVPFFSRVAASSNTFWQMMQQIRPASLATYSSHSMSWQALVDIGFWSTTMVSEDSRIFWHCYFFYDGDYRVEPLYFPVSMDSIMVQNNWNTLKGLYRQQRRWGWGAENIPYLIFNTAKRWKKLPKLDAVNKIFVQVYGFHSWATNALIIAFIGWLPLFFGGASFNAMVISGNLPNVTQTLMTLSMSGLLISAIVSTLLMPRRPVGVSRLKRAMIVLEWLLLPLGIIFFGAFPALDAQTRLMFGKYMGFLVTPKSRKEKSGSPSPAL